MADLRSGSPAGLPPVKTGECPAIAELIDYARGQISVDDRQRIDTHLRSGGCGYCQSWIERAKALASADPGPAATANPGGKWQRDAAFRDLEGRLRSLGES
jgi:hypothetical protein